MTYLFFLSSMKVTPNGDFQFATNRWNSASLNSNREDTLVVCTYVHMYLQNLESSQQYVLGSLSGIGTLVLVAINSVKSWCCSNRKISDLFPPVLDESVLWVPDPGSVR